jgi:hypothetical protein
VSRKHLAIYLNDHLAILTAGVQLVGRSAGSNEDEALGALLEDTRIRFEGDRDIVNSLFDHMGLRRDRAKVAAGWSAEKLGRLKLNGQIRGYSPLSRVTELEALSTIAHGNAAAFRALDGSDVETGAPRDLGELARLNEELRDRLDEQAKLAAVRAINSE